jgi:hypothetical protein
MTTIVTPTTMTAAYNSLSTQQQNDFKTALGITGSTTLTAAGMSASRITGMQQGTSYILAAFQMPKSGIITTSGQVGLVIPDPLNGTITVGGFLANILLSSSSKGTIGGTASTTQAGEVVSGAVTYIDGSTTGQSGFQSGLNVVNGYLTVTAGQWLTFTTLPIWQGSATNTVSVVSATTGYPTVSSQANMFSYMYIG